MDENIIIGAHHEAGHALMAYFIGRSVDSVHLNVENDILIYAVTNYVPSNEPDDWVALKKRIYCLVAGPVAQGLYQNNNVININRLGPDGTTIDNLLSNFTPQAKSNEIQEAIDAAAKFLQMPNTVNARQQIANALIQNHTLLQGELLEIAASCNVMTI